MATLNELEPNTTGDGPHQLRMAHLPSDFAPQAVTAEIFAKAKEKALLPQLGAEAIEVVYGQTNIPVTVTEPEAGQVGTGTSNEQREGGVKPLSGVGWGSRSFSPLKFAVIVTASDEFARSNPQGLFTSIRGKLSDAIARQLDLAVFHGIDALRGTALQGVDPDNVLVNTLNEVPYDPTVGVSTANTDLVNQLLAMYDSIDENYDPNRFVFDPRYRTKLAAAMRGVDANGNVLEPGSINLAAQESSVLGLPANFHKVAPGRIGAYASNTENVKAFLGDFSQLKYGFADQIRFKVSDQATLTSNDGAPTVNLWQTNQVAVMCEVTFGWVVGDLEAFSKLVETDVA